MKAFIVCYIWENNDKCEGYGDCNIYYDLIIRGICNSRIEAKKILHQFNENTGNIDMPLVFRNRMIELPSQKKIPGFGLRIEEVDMNMMINSQDILNNILKNYET